MGFVIKTAFILLMINSQIAEAQKINKKVEVKAQNSTYVYTKLSSGRQVLVAKKNSLPSVSSNSSDVRHLSYSEYTSKKSVSKTIHEVFSDSRLKELLPEKVMLVNMYINNSGRVIAVEYYLNSSTKITAFELEIFENALKRNVSFKLSKDDSNSDKVFAPITQSIHFQQVLNKTFRY